MVAVTIPAALAMPAHALDDLVISPDGPTDHRPVALIAWPSVPVEVVRAAGLRPVVMRGSAAPTPLADRYLEADVFPNRLRQLVDAALADRLGDVACVILPRTSDADYKTFLYLRELIRRGVLRTAPTLVLFDLLQSAGEDVRPYNVARTGALFAALAAIGGGQACLDDLRTAIRRTNAARVLLRRVLALRADGPRITGSEVVPLVGAFWRFDPDHYIPLVADALETLAPRGPIPGPQVRLAGAPIDGAMLHATIESLGAIVVEEVGPWGSGAAGEDIADAPDPIDALANAYRHYPCGPRTAIAGQNRWTDPPRGDAVVVVLPPDDTVFGWDYLALRSDLDAAGVPHLRVVSDPAQPTSAVDHAELAALIASVTRRRDVRHG